MATETISTPLDDIKDLAWLVHERVGYAADSLCGRGVDLEPENWAFDEATAAPYEVLARYIPGLSVDPRTGLALYSSEAAYVAVHTYDDGTPLVEHIKFDDAPGVQFTYRPRHSEPREEFMKWARESADQSKAEAHARYTSVGNLGIEFIGVEGEPFSVHLGDDLRESFTREQVQELRDGLTRILATQARAGDARIEGDGEEWPEAKEISGNEGFVQIVSVIAPHAGVAIESHNGQEQGEAVMSSTEARHLASILMERADYADQITGAAELAEYEAKCSSPE